MNNSHCKPAIQSPRRSLWTRKSWTPLKKKKKKNTRIARSISSSHRGRRDETSTHSSIHPLGAWETVASPSLESTNAKKKKKKRNPPPFLFAHYRIQIGGREDSWGMRWERKETDLLELVGGGALVAAAAEEPGEHHRGIARRRRQRLLAGGEREKDGGEQRQRQRQRPRRNGKN